MLSVRAPRKRDFGARPRDAVSEALSYLIITNLRSNAPYLAVACQNSEGSNSSLKGRYEPNQWVQLRLLLTVGSHRSDAHGRIHCGFDTRKQTGQLDAIRKSSKRLIPNGRLSDHLADKFTLLHLTSWRFPSLNIAQ
jgi:hypothetical protein